MFESSLSTYPPLLKADQVAEILNISRAMAYRLMKQDKLRTVRIGKSCRVRQEDLTHFIDTRLSLLAYEKN